MGFKQACVLPASTDKGETKEGIEWPSRNGVQDSPRDELSEEGRDGTAKAEGGSEV